MEKLNLENELVRLQERFEAYVKATDDKIEDIEDTLKEYSELNQNVILLNQTVSQLSQSMKDFSMTISKLNEKVDKIDREELEDKAKKFERIKNKIVDILIGAILGAILIKIGLTQ